MTYKEKLTLIKVITEAALEFNSTKDAHDASLNDILTILTFEEDAI